MSVTPFDYFDRVCIINLKARADRRREMGRQLGRLGTSLFAPPVQLFEAIRPDRAGGFPTLGARGCFLSHAGVLRQAARDGIAKLLILEDDLNFAEDFLPRWPRILNDLGRTDWSIFYGGYELHDTNAEGTGCVRIGSEVPVRTTHFVAFRGAAIAQVADYLEAMLQRPPGDAAGGPMHVDGAYTWFRRAHPQIATFIAIPPLGYQRASRTDIHPLRWHDRLPLVRDVVAMMRRYKNRGARLTREDR